MRISQYLYFNIFKNPSNGEIGFDNQDDFLKIA